MAWKSFKKCEFFFYIEIKEEGMDLQVSTFLATTVAVIVLLYTRTRLNEKRRVLMLIGVKTMFTIWWPMFMRQCLFYGCDDVDNDSCLRAMHTTVAVVTAMNVADTLCGFDGQSVTRGIEMEPLHLTSLIFGLSNIVGSRPCSPYSHMFVASILGCLLFVTPKLKMASTASTEIVTTLQQGIFTWCVGTLVLAVLLTYQDCQKQKTT